MKFVIHHPWYLCSNNLCVYHPFILKNTCFTVGPCIRTFLFPTFAFRALKGSYFDTFKRCLKGLIMQWWHLIYCSCGLTCKTTAKATHNLLKRHGFRQPRGMNTDGKCKSTELKSPLAVFGGGSFMLEIKKRSRYGCNSTERSDSIGFVCHFVHLLHAYEEREKKKNNWLKPASEYENGAQTIC